MQPSRIQTIDNVNIEAPFGLEEDLRWFYGELAGLEETPASQLDASGLCFKSEHLELRIRFAAEPKIEAVACRVTLAVADLEEAMELLEARFAPFTRISGFTWSDRRLQTLDPAGNRIELKKCSRIAPL